MVHNAVLGTQQFSDKQIIDRTHPAIIRSAAFRQDGGVLPGGAVVAKDSNGAMAAYNPGLAGVDNLAGGGVLIEAIDTAVEAVGPVLRHGTVVAASLNVAGGAATAADIAALEAIGIYAI